MLHQILSLTVIGSFFALYAFAHETEETKEPVKTTPTEVEALVCCKCKKKKGSPSKEEEKSTELALDTEKEKETLVACEGHTVEDEEEAKV